MAERKVWIFYSSRTEPELLDFYSEGIEYLKQSDIDAEIVDITEDKDTAQEHGITATPVLLVKHGDETNKHFGVVSGLHQILQEDLYGRSILHKLGFKEGRDAAEGIDPDAEDAVEQLEDAVASRLQDRDVTAVDIGTYRPSENTAEIAIDIESEEASGDADDFRPFLGGAFTEVFGTGVRAVVSGADEQNQRYTFTVSPPTEERKKGLGDLLKKLTDRS